MTISLNHLLVPTQDKHASARFLSALLELESRDHSVGSPPGHFAVVAVGPTGLDYADMDDFESAAA